jgi:hypothetical protein
MSSNQDNQFLVRLAINGRCLQLGEPRTTSDFFQGANSCIGLHLDLDDLHGAIEYSLIAQAETTRRSIRPSSEMSRNCDGAVCPHDRPRASRDCPGGGMWGRESRCPRTGGMHEVFIQNYEIVRLKLEEMCERSHFFGQPFLTSVKATARAAPETGDEVALAASLPVFCFECGRRLCAATSRGAKAPPTLRARPMAKAGSPRRARPMAKAGLPRRNFRRRRVGH